MRCSVLALLLLLDTLAIGQPAYASARERIAVAVLVQDEPTLSDNLTEIAIAELSARDVGELVGLLEMRARSQEITSSTLTAPSRSAESCLLDVTCSRQLTRLFGASRLLLGVVTPTPDAYDIEWSSLDLVSERQLLLRRRTLHDEAQLISEVRHASVLLPTATEGVLEVRPLAPAIVANATAPTPKLSVGDSLDSRIRLASAVPFVVVDTARRRPPVVYVGLALTAIALSSAVVTGIIATGNPRGNTRREAQEDYERRQQFSSATYGMLLAGGLLGTATAVSWVWTWR